MDFELSPEQVMIQDSIRTMVEREIDPLIAKEDPDAPLPKPVVKKIVKICAPLGLTSARLPAEVGGGNVSALTFGIMREALPPVVSFICGGQETTAFRIYHGGTPEQRERYIPALVNGDKLGCTGTTEPDTGSDARGVKTKAVFDGDHVVRLRVQHGLEDGRADVSGAGGPQPGRAQDRGGHVDGGGRASGGALLRRHRDVRRDGRRHPGGRSGNHPGARDRGTARKTGGPGGAGGRDHPEQAPLLHPQVGLQLPESSMMRVVARTGSRLCLGALLAGLAGQPEPVMAQAADRFVDEVPTYYNVPHNLPLQPLNVHEDVRGELSPDPPRRSHSFVGRDDQQDPPPPFVYLVGRDIGRDLASASRSFIGDGIPDTWLRLNARNLGFYIGRGGGYFVKALILRTKTHLYRIEDRAAAPNW